MDAHRYTKTVFLISQQETKNTLLLFYYFMYIFSYDKILFITESKLLGFMIFDQYLHPSYLFAVKQRCLYTRLVELCDDDDDKTRLSKIITI